MTNIVWVYQVLMKNTKKFIDIINKVIDAKQRTDNLKEITEILNEMNNYVLTHFANEETYMIKCNYPGV